MCWVYDFRRRQQGTPSHFEKLNVWTFENVSIWHFDRQMMLWCYTGQHLVTTWWSGITLANTWWPPGALVLHWPILGDHLVLCFYTGQHSVNTLCSGLSLASICRHIMFKRSKFQACNFSNFQTFKVWTFPGRISEYPFKAWTFESVTAWEFEMLKTWKLDRLELEVLKMMWHQMVASVTPEHQVFTKCWPV